ncbi:MAG TPA: DUF1801 domain-containing protein [Terriglobia bacterium]|nr:DUF1801 domain-containing protein [Terriglobia bacterium]
MTEDANVSAVDLYLSTKSRDFRQLAREIERFVSGLVPGAALALNQWGVPTFSLDGPLCYFIVGKKHITLGFFRGTSLEDPKGILEGTGKNLRHVNVRKAGDLARPALRALVLAAARLNREQPRSVR